jgi:hypothetical protein
MACRYAAGWMPLTLSCVSWWGGLASQTIAWFTLEPLTPGPMGPGAGLEDRSRKWPAAVC